MKIHKKLLVGFGLLILVVFSGLLFAQKAFAAQATAQDGEACAASLKFTDYANITCNTRFGNVDFVDRNPTDDTFNYTYSSNNIFCADFADDSPAEVKLQKGISSERDQVQLSETGGSIGAILNVGILNPTNPTTQCAKYGGRDGVGVTIRDSNNRINFIYQFNGSNIVSLSDVSRGSISGKSYALINDWSSTAADLSTMGFADKNTWRNCGQMGGFGDSVTIIMIQTSGGADSAIAKAYLITKGSSGIPPGAPELQQMFTKLGITGCNVVWGNLVDDQSAVAQFRIAGTPPPAPDSDGGGDGGGDEDSCADNSGAFGFAWAACPLLIAAQDFTNYLIDQFESLLSFTIPQNPTGDDGMAQVKQSWTIFRTLASALLVIILLVVVISQAIGGTFLDAYSVRKMLPRIVIAVIAMQLSWSLIVWVVVLVDHLGKGLADLMYQPFHGASQMSLGALLNHANIGTGQQTAINWVAIMGGIVLGAAALPTMLVFLFTAALGLLVGFVTLILRKLIIILTLIFVPVALILWILPGNGTQKLWKMWLDNFSKALLMFPLVVMLVAGGRILAYVAGTQGNGTFLNLLIVLVGFFGPLFILPKAFKWGGSAMQFAGNMATNLSKPVVEKGGAGVKGIGERWQGKRAKKYNTIEGRGVKAYLGRGVRRVQSGHMIPFSERSRRLTIASGNKWAEERNEEAMALALRTQEKALAGYDNHDVDDDGNFLVRRKNAAGQYLDAAGNVVSRNDASNILQVLGKDKKFKKQATFEHMTGVEAGKQALIDIAGNDGKSETAKRAAQAAVKQLIDTHSEIELQKSRIVGGANQGRRASEVYIWRDTITNSPPHYSAINSTRPDLAPDLIESAVSAAIRDGDVVAGTKYEEATAAQRQAIDKHRMRITLERMTPEQMAQAHYGLFNDIEKVGTENITYKDPITGADVTSTVAEQLAETIKRFKDSATTVGRNAVGSLRGGKELHVNKALASTGRTVDTF